MGNKNFSTKGESRVTKRIFLLIPPIGLTWLKNRRKLKQEKNYMD